MKACFLPFLIALVTSDAICLAQSPYRDYLARRSQIRNLVGDKKFILRYSVSSEAKVSMIGFNSDASEFFKLSGHLKSGVPQTVDNLLAVESFEDAELLFSNEKGAVFRLNLLTGDPSEVHLTHSFYAGLLQSFDLHFFESKLAHSPYRFTQLEERPDILQAAGQKVTGDPRFSRNKDRDFLPPMGFTCTPKDGVAEVGFVAEHRPAWYQGINAGDLIINATVNFENVAIPDLPRRLAADDVVFVRLWVDRPDANEESPVRIVDLHRETLLEAKLYQAPPR